MSKTISGNVIEVTPDGDLITDISVDQLSSVPRDESLKVVVDEEHETFGLFPADHQQPPMTFIAVLGSDDSLRLHLVGDSATMMLGVRKGAPVLLKW
ncbi:MAG: adenosylmethionine-8-amino-7-oxononanoate aminotransferase [Planctomycetota bacterium]|nr:adenosylmethionine-8-amino-7-oxononanoate aminotransferase [Planctomycetota bacterium]